MLTLESRSTGQAASKTGSQQPNDGERVADAFPEEMRLALRERDPVALANFYDSYFDRLYGYVRRMVGAEHQAEDLTQEIFMHIIEHLDSYDPTRALRPWVFTIATNKVRDFWRGRQHRASQREVSLEIDETKSWARDKAPQPVESMTEGERTEAIAVAIDALPEGMRVTLSLRYYQGLSFAEIGTIVDRNEAAVRKRYSRALEELRDLLAGLEPGGKSIEEGSE
ncbi:MAG: RNA polymerase sigma factor (sigma-70 family) [Planctomycetota bacterium]|jgi:RNA polymerase sigma factor (sigma-70 family)